MKLSKKQLNNFNSLEKYGVITNYDKENNYLSVNLDDSYGHTWISCEIDLNSYKHFYSVKDYLCGAFCQDNLDDELEFLIKTAIPCKPDIITLVSIYNGFSEDVDNIYHCLLYMEEE